MTYVGELGWELMVPVRGRRRVHDALFGEGADLGVANAGYYAIESLRLEKGFRAFGRELTPDYTPVEAGLVFATALKGDKPFLGRDGARGAPRPAGRGRPAPPAGVVRASRTPSRCSGAASCCCATARRPARSPAPPGARPSAPAVGLAYLRSDGPVTADLLAAGGFEVDVAGERFGVRLSLKAPLA